MWREESDWNGEGENIVMKIKIKIKFKKWESKKGRLVESD